MNTRLAELIESFSSRRVLILGDFLLDEFVFGEISRISREAPVLILSYRETDWRPGGGANTVAGVSSLQAQAVPVGCVGSDQWGKLLLDLWGPAVDATHVALDAALKTTRKTRILAGSFHSFRQQVTRIDYEHPHKLDQQQQDRLSDSLRQLVPGVDAIIISDYSLGTVTDGIARLSIELARSHAKPIVVDSRFRPALFTGATTITPNISELENVVGEKLSSLGHLEEVGAQLRERWELESLLVTRGKQGMSLIEKGGPTHIPPYGTDQVADVTGAGDTVTATYTTALASGAAFREAAQLANIAAGIVVTKRGTATVERSEVLQALMGGRNE